MKFYFICEGESYKSEYVFIQSIIDTYHTDEDYDLLPAGGNRNIEGVFYKEVFTKLEAGDVVILFFDNVKIIKDKPTTRILKRFMRECRSKEAVFRYTTYYCFEEIFLSYKGLCSIISVDLEVSQKLLELQNSLINEGQYPKDNSFWYDFVGMKKNTTNRETLSSLILNYLTNTAQKGFLIIKSKIGDCWISDCASTQLHQNVCDKCNFCMKGSVFKDKLDDLNNNSVAKFGLSFNTIFDK